MEVKRQKLVHVTNFEDPILDQLERLINPPKQGRTILRESHKIRRRLPEDSFIKSNRTFHEDDRGSFIANKSGYRDTPDRSIPDVVPAEDEAPVDIEIVKPYAIDLRKLYESAKIPVPANVSFALGPNIPILLLHGITPFPNERVQSASITRLGYSSSLVFPDDATTLAVAPKDESLKVGEISQKVNLGLDVGCNLGVPNTPLTSIKEIPSFFFNGAKVSTSQEINLVLQLELSFLKIVSGPSQAGGARWQFYRQNEQLTHFQPMAQTLLVPAGTKSLKVSVKSWAGKRALFGIFGKSWHWESEPSEFEVSLANL